MIFKVTAEQAIELRRLIRLETARRCGYGSLEQFSSAAYDYKDIPAEHTVIRAEHGAKTIDPLLNICDKGDLILVEVADPIPNTYDFEELYEFLTKLKAEPMYGDDTSCRSACTGLCINTCASTCFGCTGCTNQCEGCGACTTACLSACTSCGGCAGQCSGCSQECSGCTGACVDGCSDACKGGCGVACQGGCVNECTGGCASKNDSAASSCNNSCSSGCSGCAQS